MKQLSRSAGATRRRGAALVEFSLVLPLLLLLLVGSVEVGGAIVARHAVSEAARTGARVYSLKKKKTVADVYTAVAKVMEDAGLPEYQVTLDPDPATVVDQLDPLTVTISVQTNDATWVPAPWIIGGRTISARCTMPADLGEASTNASTTDDGDNALGTFDTDITREGSGVTDKELEDMQKDAQELLEKAEKKQEDADEEHAKTLEEQQEADEAAQAAEDAEQLAQEAQQTADQAEQTALEAEEQWAADPDNEDLEDAAKAARKVADDLADDAEHAAKDAVDAAEDAVKRQEDADDQAAKAAAEQQEANEAWQAYQDAALVVKLYTAIPSAGEFARRVS